MMENKMKTKKLMIWTVVFILSFVVVNALTIESGTMFAPSESNVTYNMTQTWNNVTNVTVTETCLVIDKYQWCDISSTPIIRQLTIPLAEVIDNITPASNGLISTILIIVSFFSLIIVTVVAVLMLQFISHRSLDISLLQGTIYTLVFVGILVGIAAMIFGALGGL